MTNETAIEPETLTPYQREIRTMVEATTKKWKGDRGKTLRAELLKEFDRLVLNDRTQANSLSFGP